MDEDLIFLDPCPDSVWAQLPGGPVALDDSLGEQWQYMGSVRGGGQFHHEFRHRAHPGYGNARVYAEVTDSEAGPRLSWLVAGGRELPLPDMPTSWKGNAGEGFDDLADP